MLWINPNTRFGGVKSKWTKYQKTVTSGMFTAIYDTVFVVMPSNSATVELIPGREAAMRRRGESTSRPRPRRLRIAD
jgi:hypothetical protein